MKLSIVMPVFNEEATIDKILQKVKNLKIKNVSTEIVVVDDGSTDATLKKMPKSGIKLFKHEKNKGKGSAVRTGIENATGDYVIIQDADLEYDPNDIPRLLEPVLNKKAEVVYGTRLNRMPHLSGEEKRAQFLLHYFGNRMLSLVTSVLYGQWLTDMETCYKLFPRKAVKSMNLSSRSFDFEPEITAKLLKKGYRILEIPITTVPRGYEAGKKLRTFHDGSIALWTLFKYRLSD